jgi:threonine dehydrogenase-like Zn-dependent dehydrogenase
MRAQDGSESGPDAPSDAVRTSNTDIVSKESAMQAVVFHGVGDIRLEEVSDPELVEATDALLRITASAICGTDLHMIRGTLPGMKSGTVLGHEAVGIVEAVGESVRDIAVGDRVIVPSTIACGHCAYCARGYTAQCDNANPHGTLAGTAFYGGPKAAGAFDGLQAEKARVPFADANLVKVPDDVTDDQAIMLSDIFPTGWMGALMAEIEPGDPVAVFGCGPVGQFTIASAKLMGAGRVFAIDTVPLRLEMARAQGAEVIDFEAEHPVEALRRLTAGIGPYRVIDAVGVDAEHAHHGPAKKEARKNKRQHRQDVKQAAPKQNPQGEHWVPGDAPAQVLDWAVEAVAKAGTVSIVGVYPEDFRSFPIGKAMNKNLTLKMGNCNHRAYIPHLIELVRSGAIDPQGILTHVEPMSGVIEAYEAFDLRQPGWVKVELVPGA